MRCCSATPPLARQCPSPNPQSVDNLHLVKLDEFPELIRWVELQCQAGYLSEEKAGELYVKIGVWQLRLELNQDDGH
jgi:hypothetical protein